MYEIDERDRVIEIGDLPQSSVGAPLPVVLADEHRVFVMYLVEDPEPEWDGKTVRVVGSTSEGELIATVEFSRPSAHFLGPPNDEAFSGHPLAARGLRPYGAFEVQHSSWVRTLEHRKRVHPAHRPESFADCRHFVLAFHDSIFECVARGYQSHLQRGSLRDAVQAAADRLS